MFRWLATAAATLTAALLLLPEAGAALAPASVVARARGAAIKGLHAMHAPLIAASPRARGCGIHPAAGVPPAAADGACCAGALIDDFESGVSPFSGTDSKWNFTPGAPPALTFPGLDFGYDGGLAAFNTLRPAGAAAAALPGRPAAADVLCTRAAFGLAPGMSLKVEWRAEGGSIGNHEFQVRVVDASASGSAIQATTVATVGPRREEAFSLPWVTAAVPMPAAAAARICLVWTLPAGRQEGPGAFFFVDNVRLDCDA